VLRKHIPRVLESSTVLFSYDTSYYHLCRARSWFLCFAYAQLHQTFLDAQLVIFLPSEGMSGGLHDKSDVVFVQPSIVSSTANATIVAHRRIWIEFLVSGHDT
jgi:hypothetical protein